MTKGERYVGENHTGTETVRWPEAQKAPGPQRTLTCRRWQAVCGAFAPLDTVPQRSGGSPHASLSASSPPCVPDFQCGVLYSAEDVLGEGRWWHARISFWSTNVFFQRFLKRDLFLTEAAPCLSFLCCSWNVGDPRPLAKGTVGPICPLFRPIS